MKKLILVVAFVFATGSFINAESSINEEVNKISIYKIAVESDDCIEVYERTRDFVHGMTGSLYVGIIAAIAAEEACLEEEEELAPID